MGRIKKCFYTIFFILLFISNALSATGPKIHVPEDYINFGEVSEGVIENKSIKVQNRGDRALIITDVYTNCGCTTAQIYSDHISPGGEAELKVAYNSKGKKEGKDSKSIYIISNDTEHPKFEIELMANIMIPAKSLETNKISGIPGISSDDLYSRVEKGEKITILDVREENEYIERHIPDAIWFPKSKFDRNNKEVLAKLESIDKNYPVVSYCGAGHRSSYVTKKLREKGYETYNLDGISFWEKKEYPLIRGPKLPPSQEPSIVHLEEAYDHYFVLFKDIVWVDVRNKEDYEKGHIQGALGIPLSDLEYNLDKLPKDKEIVFYCEGTWDGGKCDASMSAGRILIKNGFKPGKIKVFEDGYGAWEHAGYPTGKGGK